MAPVVSSPISRDRARRRPLRRRRRRRRGVRRPRRLRRPAAHGRRRPGSGPIARELTRDGLRFTLLAAVSYGIGYLVGAELADGIVSSLVTLAIGSVLYLATATRFAPNRRVCCSARSSPPRSPPPHERHAPHRGGRSPWGARAHERAAASPPPPTPRRRRSSASSSSSSPRSSWEHWGSPSVDAGHELTVASMIAEGHQPYVDIRYFYGPLGVYALGGTFAVFGASFTRRSPSAWSRRRRSAPPSTCWRGGWWTSSPPASRR